MLKLYEQINYIFSYIILILSRYLKSLFLVIKLPFLLSTIDQSPHFFQQYSLYCGYVSVFQYNIMYITIAKRVHTYNFTFSPFFRLSKR